MTYGNSDHLENYNSLYATAGGPENDWRTISSQTNLIGVAGIRTRENEKSNRTI